MQQADDFRRATLNLMEDAILARQALEQLNVELRESERRFREMIDALPAAVYTTDALGRLTHFNPAAVLFAGRTPQLGTDEWCVTWKLFRTDGTPLPYKECPMALAIKQGRPIRGMEIIAGRPDGTLVWVEPYPSPIRDRMGEIVGGINMLIDITERKQTETALMRWKHIFDQAGWAVAIVNDGDNTFRDVNPAFARMHGYAVEDLLGKPLFDTFAPEVRTELGEHVKTVKEIGDIEYESIHIRKDGTRFPCLTHATTFKDDNGKVLYRAATFQDLTLTRAAERALRESEERFRMLADNMSQFAWMADPKGWIFWFNQRWYDYTGTTLDEIQGWGWKSVHHPDHVERVIKRIQQSWDTGEAWEDTFPLRGKDGNYRWFLSRALPIFNSDGKVIRWFGTHTDVTEQREMAEALRQNTTEMIEADRHKNEFLAMLAHELRNPLAPIRNALQIIRLAGCNEQVVATAAETMERQVDHMVRLVDDLLDVSRISRGKIELRRERVELISTVQNAIEVCRPAIEHSNQDLIITLPPQPFYLEADPTRLTQVVGNLLNNANKFTHRGGRIWLTVLCENQQAVIRVMDNGIGIAADKIPYIFDMFMQVDSSRGRSVSGLGIGLTLVKNIIDMHGGIVEAYSAGIGHGSEFSVRLPVITLPKPLLPDLTVTKPTPSTARRILIVDDNHDSATSLAMLLKLIGNETHTAFDGLEAIDVAAAILPDVVLMDIGMPKLNGYETCRHIREQPWGERILMVALTGWGQEADKQKSKAAGFDTHMVKPIDLLALKRLLAEITPTMNSHDRQTN